MSIVIRSIIIVIARGNFPFVVIRGDMVSGDTRISEHEIDWDQFAEAVLHHHHHHGEPHHDHHHLHYCHPHPHDHHLQHFHPFIVSLTLTIAFLRRPSITQTMPLWLLKLLKESAKSFIVIIVTL